MAFTKRWYVQLLLYLVVGALLAVITINLVHTLHQTSLPSSAGDEAWGWLSFTGVGLFTGVASAIFPIIVFTVDALWVLSLVLWGIRKKFHIKSERNRLFLP